jgi:hypothetical protein
MDDAKADKAIGAWLEKQQFDPKGRTAAQLSALYAGQKFHKKSSDDLHQLSFAWLSND